MNWAKRKAFLNRHAHPQSPELSVEYLPCMVTAASPSPYAVRHSVCGAAGECHQLRHSIAHLEPHMGAAVRDTQGSPRQKNHPEITTEMSNSKY